MKRTSISHPLQIAVVHAGPTFGRVGITFCPGKYDREAMTGVWDRDLAIDVDAIRAWGAAAVVTLVESRELAMLRVPHLGEEVSRRGMSWFHLPIVDVSTPDGAFEKAWETAGEELRSKLRGGSDVLVHCRGGLGRAGTIAARLLVELGMNPNTAIEEVRRVRPGAIETDAQENFVLGLRPLRNGVEEPTDWFERLTGFRETNYDDTRTKLKVADGRLMSLVNRRTYGIGQLELVSLAELRARAKSVAGPSGRPKLSVLTGNVRQMHWAPENAGALFQVASQFNLLEMVSPSISPEQGVTRYQHDYTQGPACAIACGAATIYRNYFAPVGDDEGQTSRRQLNGLKDIGEALSRSLGIPIGALWEMRNGYALCSLEGLEAIAHHLGTLGALEVDRLRGKLRIGLHWDVEVTDAEGDSRPSVSQAFCSALPVAYTDIPPQRWATFASLILEAAYEATILAAVLNAQRGASNGVLLTQLGGGAFGNRPDWILSAIRRSLQIASQFAIDVKLVSYSEPPPAILQLCRDFS